MAHNRVLRPAPTGFSQHLIKGGETRFSAVRRESGQKVAVLTRFGPKVTKTYRRVYTGLSRLTLKM